jgi:hypothetical protein
VCQHSVPAKAKRTRLAWQRRGRFALRLIIATGTEKKPFCSGVE